MITQKISPLIVFVFIIFLLNCSNEPSVQNNEVLPNTPETVSKQWQFYLDNNEIEKMTALSTPATKEWLTENKDILLTVNQVDKTVFVKMNCQTEENKATCTYTIKEDGELIEDIFLLKKIGGQWLVDIEEDTDTPLLEEQIFKEMKRELKLD